MKLIKLTNGTAMVSKNISESTVNALNKIAELAKNLLKQKL